MRTKKWPLDLAQTVYPFNRREDRQVGVVGVCGNYLDCFHFLREKEASLSARNQDGGAAMEVWGVRRRYGIMTLGSG